MSRPEITFAKEFLAGKGLYKTGPPIKEGGEPQRQKVLVRGKKAYLITEGDLVEMLKRFKKEVTK